MADECPEIDVPVLRRAAMDCLARREHSQLELTQKLRRKYSDAQHSLIQQVIAELQADGLQSDARFVESFVRYRKSRGFGLLHIRADLQARGIDDELLQAHLHRDDDDWQAIASELTERKLGGRGLGFQSREHRRLVRFLQSRGFTTDQIRCAVDPHLDSAIATESDND